MATADRPAGGTAAPAPVVLLHGFTQTAASWDGLAPPLRDALGRPVVAPDLAGHGGRPAADLPTAATRVATEVGAVLARSLVIGYSMGGRLALHLALAHTIDTLVLIGATAGIDDPAERTERRRRDEDLAASIERDGTAAFLERWLAQPLFAGLAVDPADLAARRRNDPAGLAGSLRLAGTGAQEPLWDRLGDITVPTLVLAGERDTKFATLGRRLCDALPRGHLALVPGAGHAAHLERPTATVGLIADWLTSVRPPDRG